MSFSSELYFRVFKLCKVSRIILYRMKKKQIDNSFFKKNKYPKGFTFYNRNVDGFRLVTIRKFSNTAKHIFFLHGGAYVMKAWPQHRHIINFFLKHGFAVTFIDYPLTPEYTVEKTITVVFKAYNETIKQFPTDHFYLFGDSSGGAIAIVLLQTLRNEEFEIFPKKTVVISAPVDASESNIEIEAYQKSEVILPIDYLKRVKNYYSGKLDLKNPLVSPIYGNLNNLGHIFQCYGTREVFYPDNNSFYKKLTQASGTKVTRYIGQKMLHDWILMPIPERKETLNKMVEFFMN